MEYKNKSGPGVYKGISFVGYIHKIPALKLSDSGSYECLVKQEINGRKVSNKKKIDIEICMSLFIIINTSPNNASDCCIV